MILYTDIDPACCAVLEARVADGSLPAGDVLCADVRALTAEVLAPYAQVHLFCGIGGSPLGLKWAGWRPEWPIVTGGFPCQDISSAGRGAGLDGARSGLYREFLRVLDLKRMPLCLGENVGALSARGLNRVASEMDGMGYTLGAFRVGAWAAGSPQQRERWWLLAHLRGAGAREPVDRPECPRLEGHGGDAGQSKIAQPGHAGDPRRWPHVRWEIPDDRNPGRWVTVPTPLHEWEPPRTFGGQVQTDADGVRWSVGSGTISAVWRLALMGYPLHWLDVPADVLGRLCPKYAGKPAKLAKWWNKQGVAMTGNAQTPQNVAAIAGGMVQFVEQSA